MSHPEAAKKVLAELRSLVLKAGFLQPSVLTDPCCLALLNAIHGSTSYGQTGYLSVL